MIADVQGIAMWLLNRARRKEVGDEPIQWPIGDIEAAHRIRELCRSATLSAEKIGDPAARLGGRKKKTETDRYERAAKAAMEIALKMSDDLMRDAAVRQIVGLCMTAGDLKTARILVRAIQAESIKQEVLNEHPPLRE